MKRRKFLTTFLAFFSSATLISFLYPVVRFLAPAKAVAEAQKLAFNKSDIPVGSAKNDVYDGTPIVIIHRQGKGYIALSRVCTHLGCLVSYDQIQKSLICPCHAGKFTLDGNVVTGPAPKPLPSLPIKVEAEKVVVG